MLGTEAPSAPLSLQKRLRIPFIDEKELPRAETSLRKGQKGADEAPAYREVPIHHSNAARLGATPSTFAAFRASTYFIFSGSLPRIHLSIVVASAPLPSTAAVAEAASLWVFLFVAPSRQPAVRIAARITHETGIRARPRRTLSQPVAGSSPSDPLYFPQLQHRTSFLSFVSPAAFLLRLVVRLPPGGACWGMGTLAGAPQRLQALDRGFNSS